MTIRKISWIGLAALLAIAPSLYAQEKSAQEQERQAKIEEALRNLKATEDVQVRASAARALGELRAKEHVKELARLLKDWSAEVQSSAVWALAQLGAKEHAKEVAVALVEEPDDMARLSIATGLFMSEPQEPREFTNEVAKEVGKLLVDPRA